MSYTTFRPMFDRLYKLIEGCVVFILLLLWALPALQAQIPPQTDSLKAELEQSAGEQRIKMLLRLSDETRRASIDSAVSYAREARELSSHYENDALKADAHRILGNLLAQKANYPEALTYLLEAKEIFEHTGNLQKEALTLKNLGVLYKNQSNYNQALEYYFSALNLSEQLDDNQHFSDILLSIGVINEWLNQPEKSIEFYRRALAISRELNDASEIAIISMAMGDLYASMGQAEQALEAMNEALEASKVLPGAHAKATILMSISSVYKEEKSYQKALEANSRALALAREMSDNMLESLALQNIATVYHEQGDYSNAVKYLMQGRPLLEEIGSQQLIIENTNRIARSYFDMGDFQQSIEHSRQAFDAAYEARNFGPAKEALQLLSSAYQQIGDYENALNMHKTLLAVKDSLFDREQSRQIAEMQARYETKEKEQEIALLQKEKEQQAMFRNAFLVGFILIGIIGILIYKRQRIKIKKKRIELENTRLKEQQLEHDLEFKNKQLTTHTLHLVQKNKAMKELKEKVSEICHKENGNVNKSLQQLRSLVDYSFSLDEDWKQFRLYFEEVHDHFFDTLKEKYPDLTPNELRLSALAKLNLSIKETATILGITPNSVKTARYRLRKKLDIETEENLTEFMMEIEKEGKQLSQN